MDSCFIDSSVKSKNHNNTIKYICKCILANDVELVNTISIEDFTTAIKRYKTSSGKSLSYGSIKCLYYTMMNERQDWDTKLAKKSKNEFFSKSDSFSLYDSITSGKIMDSILIFVKYVLDLPGYEDTMVFVGRAIIIVLATNLRMAEVKQIQVRHLYMILKNETINIKFKKRLKGVRLLAHNWLIRGLVDTLPKEYNQDDLVVKVAKSTINRYLKDCINVPKDLSLGIQAIRKVNTTLLLEYCNLETAQTFNRHTRAETTDKYYNNRTYIGPMINKTMQVFSKN